MVKLLWQYGASIEAETATQIPPLHAAIRCGQIEVLRWLLEQGADANSKYGGYYWAGWLVEEVDVMTLASNFDDIMGVFKAKLVWQV